MLVNFKRDFFGPNGAYYAKGTREYNGPVEDEKGNALLPRDAVVVSEDGHLPFQARSPIPKPSFGAKPLEEQVLDMIPDAGDDHQIRAAGGPAPAPLTDEEKKAKQDGTLPPAEPTKADEELIDAVEEALPVAEAAAEKVKEIVDPLADLNLGGKDGKGKK